MNCGKWDNLWYLIQQFPVQLQYRVNSWSLEWFPSEPWQCPPVSVLSPGSGFGAGKQCQWLGLVMDLRGTLAQGRAPGKQSETWPGLARGVPESSRAARDGVLDMGPGVMEVGDANNPNTAPWDCLVSMFEAVWMNWKVIICSVCKPEKWKTKRETCAFVCTFMTVLVVLTCCAGHTNHSGDLLIRDIHCRLSTDHRPPLAPLTAAETHATRIKYSSHLGIYEWSEDEQKYQTETLPQDRQKMWNARENSCLKEFKNCIVWVCHGRNLNVMENIAASFFGERVTEKERMNLW